MTTQIAVNDIGSAEDFLAAIEGTIRNFSDGDLVVGTVVQIDREEVLLDVGYKTEGVIPSRELSIRHDADPNDIVKVGDKVESGDLLAEIESDKATMEFESFQEGVLLHIGIEAGATAPVDSILAILGEEGEDVTAILEEAKKKPAESDKIEATPKADAPVAPKTPVAPTPIPAPVESSAPKTASSAPAVLNDGKIVASPLARKLAEEKNIQTSINVL